MQKHCATATFIRFKNTLIKIQEHTMQQANFNASVFKLSLIAGAIAAIPFSTSVMAQEQTNIDEQDVEQSKLLVRAA